MTDPMKQALLAIDAILCCADAQLAIPLPDILEARAGIDAARGRLLVLLEDLEAAARN